MKDEINCKIRWVTYKRRSIQYPLRSRGNDSFRWISNGEKIK